MMYDYLLERRGELIDRIEDLQLQLDEAKGELDDIEYELDSYEYVDGYEYELSEQDEWRADDDAQRAADMNATLRDIGGGW